MNPFRIVVVGCGQMAQTWVDYTLTRQDCLIVALVDIHKESAEKFAQNKQLSCPIFTDVKEAIQATEANLVFDISIPASHYNIASTALLLGCDVLSEKPLAENFEQCIELVNLAKRTGRTHAIMQNRRYDANIRATQELITEGTIGKPTFTSADFFLAPHFGGFRDAMESPLLLDMAIHTFDQARFIIGANPVSVYCHEFNPQGSWYKGNAMALCIFEMSDGSVFDYRGSWCAEGAPTSWEGTWRIVGDKGTIIWDGREAPYAEVVAPEQEDSFLLSYNKIASSPKKQDLSFHHGCLAHMFDALKSGTQPETNSADNIYSMAMVLAALESAKRGEKVYINEFFSFS